MIPGVFAASAVNQGPRLWTPADLPVVPKIWLDWDSPVTNASGSASAWGNRGSLGNSFTQGTIASRPEILAEELNGKRALRFDGVGDYMISPESREFARNAGEAVLLTVIRPREKVGSGCIIGVNAGGSGARARINCGYGYPTSEGAYAASARRDATDAEAIATSVLAADTWSIAVWRYGYSADSIGIRVNGGDEDTDSPAWGSSTATSDTTSGHNANVGRYPTGGNFLDADIAAIIGVDTGLSVPDRERLEGWAAWKCGLQGNLPAGHPYKSAPPTV